MEPETLDGRYDRSVGRPVASRPSRPPERVQGMDVNPVIAKLGRRLRLGVVGGGPDSFIGEVHRSAARLDDRYEVVASVLSSNPERSRAAGRAIGVVKERAYGTFEEMFEGEAGRPDGIDVLAIMTPYDSHYALSRAALDRNLDVICEKPLTTTIDDAVDLVRRVRNSGLMSSRLRASRNGHRSFFCDCCGSKPWPASVLALCFHPGLGPASSRGVRGAPTPNV